MGIDDFEDLRNESTRKLMAGELVACAEPHEPGSFVCVHDLRGDEVWVDDRFIQWEGES